MTDATPENPTEHVEEESPVIALAKMYHRQALEGDEHLHMTDDGTVVWRTESQTCHLLCPSEESQGYGILQITEADEATNGFAYTRYLFDATAIVDKVTCAIPRDAVDRLDQQTFDDMMFDLSELSDEEIGPHDEDRFFTALFSAEGSQ